MTGPNKETQKKMDRVRECHAKGMLDTEIASEMGVTREYVRQLRNKLGLPVIKNGDWRKVEPIIEAGFDVIEYTGKGWLVRCTKCGFEKVRPLHDAALKCVNCSIGQPVIIGTVYGSWTVVSSTTTYSANKQRLVRVRCKCGRENDVPLTYLNLGRSTQCKSCARKAYWERQRATR